MVEPARGQRLGLGQLGAADPDGTRGELPAGDLDGLVGLGVRPKTDATLGRELRHRRNVRLEGIEIENERRRVDAQPVALLPDQRPVPGLALPVHALSPQAGDQPLLAEPAPSGERSVDGGAHGTCHGDGIVGREDGRDHGDPIGAVLDRQRCALEIDAADGDDRLFRAGRASRPAPRAPAAGLCPPWSRSRRPGSRPDSPPPGRPRRPSPRDARSRGRRACRHRSRDARALPADRSARHGRRQHPPPGPRRPGRSRSPARPSGRSRSTRAIARRRSVAVDACLSRSCTSVTPARATASTRAGRSRSPTRPGSVTR